MPLMCVFEDFAEAFPSPGVTRRQLLEWAKRGRFPAGVRPAGGKSDVHFKRSDVIQWFSANYSQCWPESVRRVCAALAEQVPPVSARTMRPNAHLKGDVS